VEREEVIRLLDGFPAESDRAFETAAVDLMMARGAARVDLDHILGDAEAPIERRYAAFFSLGTFLRRRRDVSLLIELIGDHRHEFSQFGTFAHLEAMALSQRGGEHDLRAALARAGEAMEIHPDHPGILHSFASISLNALDEEVELDREQTLSAARTALDQALQKDPKYAKFHATRARWYLANGRPTEARQSALLAIDLEDSTHTDYHLRLSEYNTLLSSITLRQSQQILERQVENVREESERVQADMRRFVTEIQIRYLELLGFFSVIVGLVLSGVQIATGMAVADAARILLVVAGAILIAFSPLTTITGRPWRHAAVFLGLGASLILLGLMADRLAGTAL
jgi:hypothetical protein